MESEKIDAEYVELMNIIAGLKEIIENEHKLLALIKEELTALNLPTQMNEKQSFLMLKAMSGWKISYRMTGAL